MGLNAILDLPKKLRQQLAEEHGSDTRHWNQELRDLFDVSIEARDIAPPLSGRVEKILNTDYHYHWAFDRCGSEPNHDRVESLKYAGWEFATTDDVQMCSEASVISRSKDKKSKDGKGFSDELRSGDRRLMKLRMDLWRSDRKAKNLAAFNMTYPQTFMGVANNREGASDRSVVASAIGKVMTASDLIPGVSSRMMDEREIEATEPTARAQNPKTPKRED